MSAITVINRKGESCGEVEFPEELMELKRGDQAVHDVVTAFQAARRAGSASTLNKSSVSAGNKKPWRQKGLGRARAGYRSSPIWRGGGVVFGPHPRSYAKNVNRKIQRLAFRRALSEKVSAGAVRIIDSFDLPDAKTKSMVQLLRDLAIAGKTLALAAEPAQELMRAARNLPDLELVRARNVNTYQLLRYPVVLADRAAVDVLIQRLGNKAVTD